MEANASTKNVRGPGDVAATAAGEAPRQGSLGGTGIGLLRGRSRGGDAGGGVCDHGETNGEKHGEEDE
jgi:hypothetical protein